MSRSFSYLLRNIFIWTASVCALFVAAFIAEGVGFAAAVTFAVVMTASVAVPFIAINEDQRQVRLSEQARRHGRPPRRPD
jgi:uncharacterized protein (DUF58 family)